MKDSFYATIKLLTGEEILSEVMQEEMHGVSFFVLSNPIIMEEMFDIDNGNVKGGTIPKKWLSYANDDMHIVNTNHVITMSELDSFGIDFYKKAIIASRLHSPIKREVQSKNHSGFLGHTKTIREKLEEIYNNSHDIPE